MPSGAIDIDSRVDAWKKKLLDLSKRNRLLSYRDTKRGSIRIVAPDALTLWKDFVEDENPIIFSYINDEMEEEDDNGESEPRLTIVGGNVETNKTLPEQQKTLRSLRNKARSFINEQGVNALYLSFGFLNWTESANSSQIIQSPLILVPVTLQWESITSPFVLQLHDDEVVVNPTLVYKMESDFGMALPNFNIGDSLQSYFDKLNAHVASQGWEVEQSVSLSLLSFLKINMYNDLENHRESINSHPVVRALAGDISGLTVDVSSLDGFDHDANITPANSFLIVDADASQMDAIECAKKDASFVLQGPPGTGKSQTITNIIAECLADGKKVLFVSEKMAALDVVHRRLKDAGLEDFALVLHSYKANKKEVLEQLGRSLELSGSQMKLAKEAYQSLEQLLDDKKRLNDYTKQLHEVIEPLHRSIFDANAEIARYCDVEDIVFPVTNIRNVADEDYRRMNGVLRRYENVVGSMHEAVANNPWYDTSLSFVGNELRHDLASKASACESGLVKIIALIDESREQFGFSADNLQGLSELANTLNVAERSFKVPASWVEDRDFDTLYSICDDQRQKHDEVLSALADMEAVRRELGMDAILAAQKPCYSNSELKGCLEKCRRDIDARFDGDPLLDSWRNLADGLDVIAAIKELKKRSESIHVLKGKSEETFSAIVERLDYKPVQERFETVYDCAFLKKRELYLADKAILEGVTPLQSSVLDNNESTLLALDKVRKMADLREWAASSPELAELATLEKQIVDTCEAEIESIPYNDIFIRFKTTSASFTKLFNSQYRNDKAVVGGLMKNLGGKPTDEQILSVLGMLRRRDELKQWRSSSKEHNDLISLESDVRPLFEEGVFDIDHDCIFQRYRNDYDAEFAETNARYESDMALFENCVLSGKRIGHDDVLAEIDILEHLAQDEQWFDENDARLSKLLGDLYFREDTAFDRLDSRVEIFSLLNRCEESCKSAETIVAISDTQAGDLKNAIGPDYIGVCSDWNKVSEKLRWASELSQVVAKQSNAVSASFIARVCDDPGFAADCAILKSRITAALDDVNEPVSWFSKLFEDSQSVVALPAGRLLDKIEACSRNLDALEEIIDYRKEKAACAELGLGECVAALERAEVPHDQILPVFRKRFFRLWLDSVLPEYPVVASFRHRTQEETIKEFCDLDKRQMAIARSRVKAKLINAMPPLDRFTSGMDDIHILQREMAKKRRVMPIRRLFNSIPELIMTLKPCLMMSPLSVSLFLESDLFQFDTVIFDEASQVCTENAIGAIFRGKQVIIAGDSKQLPPSSFFAAAAMDSDFDSEDEEDEQVSDVGAFESVLDEASLLPERTLLWHYRSRHEHLIAFSNAKIYRNRLITFPSAIDSAPDYGVEYVLVENGFYDRGGRKGNVPEAERVAELVFDHFRRNPGRSLGVIAFGSVQEYAIDTAVRRMRMKNQEFEQFFDEDADEPFFIKSLENVQGDERDTIIFSIGYAKDSQGVMRMQFGPLSQTGGERRLNVAITRAKYNVKLVGSIYPTDIATDRVSAEGPKLLRSYIDFAWRGPEALEEELSVSETLEFDSPFEESVYDFLDSKGYRLSTQVGCSGYRIDMAVKHPDLNGRYVLGIECDGATYHSARTARERDRLRQDVLEGMGWKIYRIWSTDWIKSPATERQRLVDAIERALSEYVERRPQPIQAESKLIELIEEPDYEIVEKRELSDADTTNPYGFEKMQEPDYDTLPRDYYGYLSLDDCIELLVRCQYPIHFDVAAQALCGLFGNQRAGKTVKNSIRQTVDRMNAVIEKDGFLFPAEYDYIPAYGACGRSIKHISLDELGTAMCRVCASRIGLTKDTLIEETARAYGFNRIGPNIRDAFGKAYRTLLDRKALSEVEEKVVPQKKLEPIKLGD